MEVLYDMTEVFLTPDEAAQRLKVQARTVRGWIKTGKLPGVKLGRIWRISESALNEFIRTGKFSTD